MDSGKTFMTNHISNFQIFEKKIHEITDQVKKQIIIEEVGGDLCKAQISTKGPTALQINECN